MTRDEIREIFLAHGFTIKPGNDDLKPYVYEAAEALLRAPPRVPEGYVLVPNEPTAEMFAACNTILQGYGAKLAWQRMVAAAPKPPAGQSGGEEECRSPLAAPTEAEVEACAEAGYIALEIRSHSVIPWNSWNDPDSKDMYRAEARACLTKFQALRGGK